ncbi:hypothetical protein AGMMS50262_06610 [Bacteroidia bacterium]|nr:hypothetical protein AGMMS50262_06610 [Bacteroidia bacterium]
MPFEASTSWDNGLASQDVFLWQSDFLYRDMYADFSSSLFNPSGDFLTNVFGSSYLGTGISTDDGHRDHLAISSIPIGSGGLFLLIISVLYFSILFTKKHLLKMKTTIHPSKSPLKGRLWLTHNVESSQTLKSPFRGFGGKLSLLILLFLTIFTGNIRAQVHAGNNDFFVQPNSTDNYLNVFRSDELGGCDETTIKIIITQNPHGTATAAINSATNSNSIKYTPPITGFIQDTLKYKIACANDTSNVATVYINIADKPENIMEEVCEITPQPTVWAMREADNLGEVDAYQISLIGDMDGDGNPEIVTVYQHGTQQTPISDMHAGNSAQNLTVFRGVTHSRINFPTVAPFTCVAPGIIGIVKTKIQNSSGIEQDSAIIVVAEGDFYLRAYDMYGNLVWTASDKWTNLTYANDNYPGISVNFADFNNDGYAEVYVGNRIFDAATGTLLCQGTGNDGSAWVPGSTENQWHANLTIAGDVYGDSRLELIAGNQIYQVESDLTSMTVVQQLNSSLLTCIEDGSQIITGDGYTQLADIDGDGNLDIIVENLTSTNQVFIYIWSPAKNTLLAQKLISTSPTSIRFGVPFIGDIDGDSKVEILFIAGRVYSVSTTYFLYAYKYVEGNNLLQLFWKLSHEDNSLMTGLTLFDFNQDGVAEIVYRDEKNLRIINGSGTGVNYLDNPATINPTTKLLTNYELVAPLVCTSATGYEYPVIADIDNDGEAEIIIPGGTSANPLNAPLRIFKSNGSSWAPARPVWNQYAYNPVYINDDLTVPAHPLNPATGFVGKSETTGNDTIRYPFNNFLQQATLLNEHGRMFRAVADLAFDKTQGTNSKGITFVKNGNDYNVTVYVTNVGDFDFPRNSSSANLQITANIKNSLGNIERVYTGVFTQGVAKGGFQTYTFTITGIAATVTDPDDNIQIVLNDLDGDIYHGDEECKKWNNYSLSLAGIQNVLLCEGPGQIQFGDGDPNYTYQWYRVMSEGSPFATGATITYTKNATDTLETVYVDIYNSSNVLVNTAGRNIVNIYLAPDSLIWTGAGNNNDWNDYNNWLDPNDLSPKYPLSKVPRECTHVLIPDGLTYYPNLDDINTNRANIPDASCNHIHFEFGGEVARTDLLNYTKAWIQYNFGYFNTTGNPVEYPGQATNSPSYMERDQWYALSAPLNKIVTGDFSLGGKPHTWQKRFVRSDAQTGTFTGAFDWPDDTVLPNNEAELNEDLGFAIALLVADHNPGYNGEDWSKGYQAGLDTLTGIITLPYFEGPYDESDFDNSSSHIHPHRVHKYDTGSKTSYFKEYWYYVPDVPLTTHPQGSIQRENEAYRFIFDGKIEQMAGKNAFKVTVPTGKEIMLGNPFMSSLKFDNFYQANSAAINDYYRLYNGAFNTYGYQTGAANLTDTIAVLQAFFITTTGTPGSTVDLYFPFETTSITRETAKAHQDYFKSPKANNDVIYVTATSHENKKKATSATLALNQDGQNVYQLFYEASNNIPQVYFTDENGQKNAVQYSTENENQATTTIPLGLRSGFGNRVTLTFDINAEVEALTLLDKKTGQTQDLLQNHSYTFMQSDNTTPYIDRFALSFKSPTAISEIKNESKIAIYQDNETVTVSSLEKINSVELFDMQGRRIKQADQIENNVYQMNLRRGVARNAPTGVYIVKAVLGNGEAQTRRIIVK